MDEQRDRRTPEELAAAAEQAVQTLVELSRDLDAMARWLLTNAHRLRDDRAAAAGYSGMPPMLPFMLRELLNLAADSHALADRLTPFAPGADQPGALGFDRLQFRAHE